LTRTDDKRDAILKHGARHVIATESQDVVEEVRKITGGKGARIAFDPVGGPMVEKLAESISAHGILFQYGALSTEATPLPLFPTLAKMLTIRGYLLFEVTSDPARLAKGKQFVFDGLASGALKPTISKTFRFEQIVDAHRYLESNSQIGKIVVRVD
jgi:NADPH:quinone reductase-like Zn-dependent oxidoreductase